MMLFAAIAIVAYFVYPPAVTYVIGTWAAIYLFTFTYSLISAFKAKV